MGSLTFYAGTMSSGKSTLALQTHYNHSLRGRQGLVYTRKDRAGQAVLSSRLGIATPALEVADDYDFYGEVSATLGNGGHVDYLVCDEAQFYSPTQIEQLARLVDILGLDVYAFAITTDFRTRLFPGTARLLELADQVIVSPVPALCWCGARGTHQARLINGVMVTEGAQVVIGDTGGTEPVTYEVLCRKHHMEGTARPRE